MKGIQAQILFVGVMQAKKLIGLIMEESYEKEKRRRTLITLSKMKMNTQHKVDITDYQDIADCIRSDQVPANHIAEYFTDKKFYEWYKKKYL